MREFLLNSEQQLDRNALAHLKKEGRDHGLFPCEAIRFNRRVKLAFFTEDAEPLSDMLGELSLNECCEIAKGILRRVRALEKQDIISLENIVWDVDSIYLDQNRRVFLLCLPALIPADAVHSDIYKKRLYALIEDIVSGKKESRTVCRQIDYEKGKAFGDWVRLENALERRTPEEDEMLILKGINTSDPLTFRGGHETFRIGSDEGDVSGYIPDVESVSPLHAVIGWNEINFFVKDMGSETGTFVNNRPVVPYIEIPIGQGSVLRFGDYTFNVE